MSSAGATTFEPDMANVGSARRFVREQLAGHAPAAVVDDLALVTSELVTNAFEHGSPEPVALRVAVNAGSAAVTVTSRGDGERIPAVDQWATATSEQLSGRGLGIVRAIADDIDVQRSSGSVTITVHRRFG